MPKDLTPQKIISMLLRHVKLIILIAVLSTLITYGYSKFFITPSYSASALILIQNYDEDSAKQATTSPYYNTGRVNVGDISASATLAGNCVVLFSNSPDMTALMTGASVTIEQESESNFIRITATSSNPQLAANVANQLAEQAPVCFADKFTYGKVDTIRSATAPSEPSAPNVNQNTMFGFFVGLILGVLLAFFLEIIDTTIKPGDDLAKLYKLPVFAEIVDFEKEG